MPYYYKLGETPHKRHTQFRKPDGGLYSEQLFLPKVSQMIIPYCTMFIPQRKLSKRKNPSMFPQKLLKKKC